MNAPELCFCKAEELAPKCFCKDKKGGLALPLSQTELSELLGTGAVSSSRGKRKWIVSAVFTGQRMRALKQT